jgi:predicted Zn-dependent protease
MFDKLQQASRLNDNGAFPYLRSHPMTTERMADMQARQQLAGRTGRPPRFAGTCHGGGAGAGAVRYRARRACGHVWLRPKRGNSPAFPAAPGRQLLYGAAIASIKLRDPASAAAPCTGLAELAVSEPAAEMSGPVAGGRGRAGRR